MRRVVRAPRRASAAALACAMVMLMMALAEAAAPIFPALTGRVVDEAGILSPATRGRLDQELARHEQGTGEQVVVVTLASLQGYTIEDFGYQLGRHWGIGQSGRDNGALLIVAPKEHKTRIEVGYGLEDRLTDAQSRIIIEQVMLPAFRRGDYDTGVLDGTAAVLRVLGGGAPVVGAQQQQPPAGTAPRSDSSGLPAPAGGSGWGSLVFGYLFLFIFALWIAGVLVMGLFSLLFSARSYRHGGGFFYGGGFSGGGSSGGGDFSGGGFSGGGGSFGGGGASGSW
jgi:uncharacterized protein